MHWLSRAELVSAVANAGGLACLASSSFLTKEALLDEIQKTRDLTDKPFGVNVSLFPALLPKPPDECIDTIIESGVKILETAGNNPEPYRKMIVDSGLTHIHKCARVQDAVKADRLDVDIVSIVGTECGGHPGMDEVTSLVLIPQAVDAIQAPLIAGGGFSDGRSLASVLSLGADCVNMGTRFIATKECPVHQIVKEKLVASSETNTVLVLKSHGNPIRVLKTPWTEKILEMEDNGVSFEELIPMIQGQISRKGWQTGDLDEGIFPVGQVMGCIKDILCVEDVIENIIRDASEVIGKLPQVLL